MSKILYFTPKQHILATDFLAMEGFERYYKTPKSPVLVITPLTSISHNSNIFYNAPDSVAITTLQDNDLYKFEYHGTTLNVGALEYYVKKEGSMKRMVIGAIINIMLCISLIGAGMTFIYIAGK